MDSTFAQHGIFRDNFNGLTGSAEAVALQSDGKIVIGGQIGGMNNTASRGVILRLNTNGTLDSSFGSTVIVTIRFAAIDDVLDGLAIQTDGGCAFPFGLTGNASIVCLMVSLRFDGPWSAVPGAQVTTFHFTRRLFTVNMKAFTDTRVIGAWMITLLSMLITFLISEYRLWLGHLQLAIFMGVSLVVRIFGFMNDGTTLAMGNQTPITIVEIVFLC